MIIILSFATEDDRQKFEFLYSKYKNLMLKKAYDILGDYMLAEDAVSEAYLRVYRNLHKIDDPASNRSIAFVVTIARNTALTLLRRRKDLTADPLEEVQPDSFDLERQVLSDVSSEGIYAMLGGLSEELRAVFVLKFAYDLPHKEIGRLLDISENNVTVRLHRAKKKLSEILIREGYVHDAR